MTKVYFKSANATKTILAALFLAANVNASDYLGKVAKAAKQASADLEQVAKKFEKLRSDKIKVEEDERGVVLTFSAQLFAVGKADLTEEAKENLLEASKTLEEYSNMNVEIEGHTDSTGSVKINQELSEKRARNVMDFLAEQGIEKERLSAVGYGKDRPIADNGTEEGRAANRRVELIVKEKPKQEKEPEPKIEDNGEKIRFGARGNINYSGTGMVIGMTAGKDMTIDGGSGAGLGAFAIIPFASIYFVPEISFQYRVPIDVDDPLLKITLKEMEIDVPLLFRFRYREENLIYLGVGPMLGYVISSNYDKGTGEFLNRDREILDYGIVLELGFRINSNFSIDIRSSSSFASIGFSEYFTKNIADIPADKANLYQFQIGVSYVF